jgi:hypothetical protein
LNLLLKDLQSCILNAWCRARQRSKKARKHERKTVPTRAYRRQRSIVAIARRNALGQLLDFAKLVSWMTAGTAAETSSAIGKGRNA